MFAALNSGKLTLNSPSHREINEIKVLDGDKKVNDELNSISIM